MPQFAGLRPSHRSRVWLPALEEAQKASKANNKIVERECSLITCLLPLRSRNNTLRKIVISQSLYQLELSGPTAATTPIVGKSVTRPAVPSATVTNTKPRGPPRL